MLFVISLQWNNTYKHNRFCSWLTGYKFIVILGVVMFTNEIDMAYVNKDGIHVTNYLVSQILCSYYFSIHGINKLLHVWACIRFYSLALKIYYSLARYARSFVIYFQSSWIKTVCALKHVIIYIYPTFV